VQYLGQWFQSFVYVDYRYEREMFLDELEKRPFRKYQVLGMRSVSMSELAPNGWTQPFFTKALREAGWCADRIEKVPFCEWVILERDVSAAASYGPERFSLLYLNADGVEAYHSLYVGNAQRASAIAVIQPGHAFGFNWTNFTDPKAVLARVVMGNPAGVPDFYVSGGIGPRKYLPAPWPEYTGRLGWYPYGGIGSVGVWERTIEREARISIEA
jgi:hypothetical protein